MTDALPTAITLVAARIVAPEPASGPSDLRLTGELADLATWWMSVSTGAAPVAVELTAPSGPASAEEAAVAGIAAADRAIDAGATLLIPRVPTRDAVAARATVVLLTRREPSAVLPQPEGMSDQAWMDTCAAIRDAAGGAADRRGEPLRLLDALGSPAIAAAAGVLLGAAARRTPCLLDGTDELAAALVADRLCYRASGWWRAATTSTDPARAAAAERIDLAPGMPLGLSDDAGLGAQATLSLLRLVTADDC